MFITFFPASLHVNDVTPAVVRRFLDWREDQGISPSSLKKDLGCLSMVFRFLVREGLARGNPCDAVTVRAKAKRNPAMTESEFVELRSTISKELSSASNPEERRTAQDLLDLVDVLWHSGLRFVESVRVTWEDIDLSSANWTIRSPYNKGGTQTIPLHHDVLPILKRRKLLATPGPFAGYWHFSNLWRDFKHRNAAFRGWGFHRMRHAFVTRLRKNGFDAAAMALARHKTVAMSVHYTHLEPSDFREHLDAL